MRRPDRAPGTTWCLRRDFKDWVRTRENDMIQIQVSGQSIEITRADARLLIRRLDQCLANTRLP